MGNNGKPEPTLTWTVQLGIPVPVRLARRASKPALSKYLAKALGMAFQAVPPEFIIQSVEKIKADAGRMGLRLVGPDGKEFGISSGKPYRM